MNRKLFVRVILLVVALVLGAATVTAQVPAAPLLSPQSLLGSAFTYQGQLKNNGIAVRGSCDMAFRLYDAASVGNQVGSPLTQTVTLNNGLFTTALDFGASAFNGDARWLDAQVRCPTGSGSFVALGPRQALTATPYALSLMPNATINGLTNIGNLSFGAATRQMLNLFSTQYGIGVQNYTLYQRTDSSGGFAWYAGGAHSDTQNDPGPFGIVYMLLNANGLTVNNKVSASTNSASPGAAVVGANAGSGYGVYGQSNVGSGVLGEGGTSGNGVVGIAVDVNSSGVNGSHTGGGYGVKGSGGLGGVYGTTANSTGGGVYGTNTTSSYVNTGGGVVGFALNTNGIVAISINSRPIMALGSNLNDPKFYVENNGNVFADGTYSSPAADFAELLPATDGMQGGDVLAVDANGKLVLSSEAYQTTVVGVYSTKPAFLGGSSDELDMSGKVPLAVVGVVPVKVSAENGAIQPGDMLVTSSTPGYAMKAGANPPRGTVIGKALGALEHGTGVIQLLVSVQ